MMIAVGILVVENVGANAYRESRVEQHALKQAGGAQRPESKARLAELQRALANKASQFRRHACR
jgi:hypothetical protein